MRIRIGAKKDGTLVAFDGTIHNEQGAYASPRPVVPPAGGVHIHAMVMMPGPYEIPNCRVEAFLVYTNNPYCGAMRGFGAPQVCFAHESILDELAAELGMNPIDLRRKNAFWKGSKTATGQVLDQSVGLRETPRGLRQGLRLGPAVSRGGLHRQGEDEAPRRGPRHGVVPDEHRPGQRRLRDEHSRPRRRVGPGLRRDHRDGPGGLHRLLPDLCRGPRHPARGCPHRPARHRLRARIGPHRGEPLHRPHGQRHPRGRQAHPRVDLRRGLPVALRAGREAGSEEPARLDREQPDRALPFKTVAARCAATGKRAHRPGLVGSPGVDPRPPRRPRETPTTSSLIRPRWPRSSSTSRRARWR